MHLFFLSSLSLISFLSLVVLLEDIPQSLIVSSLIFRVEELDVLLASSVSVTQMILNLPVTLTSPLGFSS